MTGTSLPYYFHLPFEFRPEIDTTDLALAKGGSPPWQILPSYPSPPMSSSPSPQRKVSDIQPPSASGVRVPDDTASPSSVFIIPPPSASLPTSTHQHASQTLSHITTAGSSEIFRKYSSSSSGSESQRNKTDSISSINNVRDSLPTAGPSIGPTSPNMARGGRRAKSHVANACNNCKRAHLSCDVERPCGRCVATGKADTCHDVPHKKRGRPRLRDEGQFYLQQGDSVEPEAAELPGMASLSGRSMARPGHRKTASLRTLAAFAGELQGTLPSSPPVAPGLGLEQPQPQPLGTASSASYPPPLRQPRLAPSPEVPIAFLDTDFVVLKANATFQRLFSWLKDVKGMRLSDIAKPVEGDSFQNARNRLREERENREPSYLPPILQPRPDPVAGIGTSDHDVEEVTRGFADHQFAWTFRLGGGVDRTLPVRMRLAKTSVYFVTLFLPPLPQQVREHILTQQPPPAMFPSHSTAPPSAFYQFNTHTFERQTGSSESLPTYYTTSPISMPQSFSTARQSFSFDQQQAQYPQSMYSQPQYTHQQPQQMLPPPPNLASVSDQRPGAASGLSGTGSIMAHPQASYLPPPTTRMRPRSDTMDSLGRHIQTRLRADSGATVSVFQSSPVQQRHNTERTSSETEWEVEGIARGSPRKRRRLGIDEMLQR